MWLFKQKPEFLDPLVKYHSCTSGLGKNFVEPRKVNRASASCCGDLAGVLLCAAWYRAEGLVMEVLGLERKLAVC